MVNLNYNTQIYPGVLYTPWAMTNDLIKFVISPQDDTFIPVSCFYGINKSTKLLSQIDDYINWKS